MTKQFLIDLYETLYKHNVDMMTNDDGYIVFVFYQESGQVITQIKAEIKPGYDVDRGDFFEV